MSRPIFLITNKLSPGLKSRIRVWVRDTALRMGLTVRWIRNDLGTMNELDYSDPGVVIIDVRDLEDGLNEPAVVWRKIGAALCALSLGNRVAVRCHAGISRSNAIAAGVLAIRENRSYIQALKITRERIPSSLPNEGIVESVQTALNTHARKG